MARTGSLGGLGAMGPIEAYIRQAAIARGIDPDIAVRVARSEGGLSNPVRQSDVVRNGVREQSYGPFQLYMAGGLGNRALAAGIDPRDPNQWQAGVDFALDEAKRAGWGQWYGAAKVGVGSRTGLGGKGSSASKTYSVGPGFKGQNPNYVPPQPLPPEQRLAEKPPVDLRKYSPSDPYGSGETAGLSVPPPLDLEALWPLIQPQEVPRPKLKRTLAEIPKRVL